MKIQEIMTKPAAICRPSDSLSAAAQLMWERDCGALPVVSEDGMIVGMITDRDICMSAYTRGDRLGAIAVSNAMAHEVFFCNPGEPLEAAERLMSEHQIRRIPVVDSDGRLVGVLSLNDLARYAASARNKNGLAREIIHVLAAISQPRPAAKPAAEPWPRKGQERPQERTQLRT